MSRVAIRDRVFAGENDVAAAASLDRRAKTGHAGADHEHVGEDLSEALALEVQEVAASGEMFGHGSICYYRYR
jgi:hypothetical protein